MILFVERSCDQVVYKENHFFFLWKSKFLLPNDHFHAYLIAVHPSCNSINGLVTRQWPTTFCATCGIMVVYTHCFVYIFTVVVASVKYLNTHCQIQSWTYRANMCGFTLVATPMLQSLSRYKLCSPHPFRRPLFIPVHLPSSIPDLQLPQFELVTRVLSEIINRCVWQSQCTMYIVHYYNIVCDLQYSPSV